METTPTSTLTKRLDNVTVALRSFNEALTTDPGSLLLLNEVRDLQQQSERCAAVKDNLAVGITHLELDTQGTSLWNCTANMLRDAESGLNEIALEARVLACFTLDCAWERGTSGEQDTARLFQVAVKTGKMLFESDRATQALKVFERAAKFQEIYSATSDLQQDHDNSGSYLRCVSDYLLTRMTLAWKQGTLGGADALYRKAEDHFSQVRDTQAIEKFADVLLKIGKDILLQNVFDGAVLWLKRAYDVTVKIYPELILEEAQELKLGIMHSLAKAYIGRRADGDLGQARALVDLMEGNWYSRIVVHLLKLDLVELEKKQGFEQYEKAVRQMVQVATLSELTLHASVAACSSLDLLLGKRILMANRDDWIERVFITRLWVTVQDPKASMQSLVSTMKTHPTTTHSSQIKVSQDFYVQGKFSECAAWCKTLLHSIFDRTAATNVGKISRRLMACALNLKRYDEAKSAYDAIPDAEKDTAATQFLLFKLALRTMGDERVIQCLETICDQPNPDKRAIYACVMDAEEVDNKRVALLGMEKITDILENLPPDSLHIPTLLRCNISLKFTEMDLPTSQDMTPTAKSICEILRCRASQKIEELEWFSRFTYNLALRSIDEWGETIALRLLRSCLQILALFPTDMDGQNQQDYAIRRLHCYYLRIELARPEAEIDTRQEWFMGVCECAGEFRRLWREASEKLAQMYGTVLVLEFEARISLKNWDALEGIIDAGELCADSKTYETLGDMALRSKAPHRNILSILRKIFQLSAFLRAQLQLSILNDPKTNEELVKQIMMLIKLGNEYPMNEVHWISATLWNRAIDYHSVGDRDNFKRFGEMAFSIAGLMGGAQGAAYVKALQEKFIIMGTD